MRIRSYQGRPLYVHLQIRYLCEIYWFFYFGSAIIRKNWTRLSSRYEMMGISKIGKLVWTARLLTTL